MKDSRSGGIHIDGASNFRGVKVATCSIYGVAQPTINGIKNVINTIQIQGNKASSLIWINLREEPLIYINGIPYVLRDLYFNTLRNLESYAGITAGRLEALEWRLKEDVLTEVNNFNGILLHNETEDGAVFPSWEEVAPDNILTLREVMSNMLPIEEDGVVSFHRIPLTAEAAPEDGDFDDMLRLITQVDLSSLSIVL